MLFISSLGRYITTPLLPMYHDFSYLSRFLASLLL